MESTDVAVKVLITGGTLVLLYGFFLGFPMAQARMKGPEAPRQLVNVHLEALMSGAALLGLSIAAEFSTLASGWEQVAAWLLVGGVAATLLGGTLNWLMKVTDAFAAKPPGSSFRASAGRWWSPEGSSWPWAC